jgi:hypothetical protein
LTLNEATIFNSKSLNWYLYMKQSIFIFISCICYSLIIFFYFILTSFKFYL